MVFKTFMPMLTAGNASRLEYEDYQKLLRFLQDNPDAIVVLRSKHIMLFCKKPHVYVRRSLWKEPSEFESEFGLKLRLVKTTDTFHICASLNSDAIAEMEQLAVEVSGQMQDEAEHICSDSSETKPEPKQKGEVKSKRKAKSRRDEKCTTKPCTNSQRKSSKARTKSQR